MRRTALALALAGLLAAPAGAQTPAASVIETDARNVAIFDHGSKRLLYCQDCDVPMPPASMSKLMTMLIVAERLKSGAITEDTRYPVSEKAWRHGAQSDGSHMFLELGSEVRVGDLIRGVVIVSANDACIALAEGVAGSEAGFVDLMNARARELGLTTARFANTTGLPQPDHLISAADLARLASHIIDAHPELYRLYAERAFTFNGRTQQNRNPLLGRVAGADGVKTGHTNASGYGLIGSAVAGDERRIVVFNGLPTMAARADAGAALMEAAFSRFALRRVYAAGVEVGEAPVWMGGRPVVRLATAAPVEIVAPRALLGALKAEIVFQGPLPAPIAEGEAVAELVVSGPGFAEQRFPLVAAQRVGRANPVSRALHGASLALGGS